MRGQLPGHTCQKEIKGDFWIFWAQQSAEELSGVACSLLHFEARTSVFELHLRSECGVEASNFQPASSHP